MLFTTILKSFGLGIGTLVGLTATHFALSRSIKENKKSIAFKKKYPHLQFYKPLLENLFELNEYRFFIDLHPFFESCDQYVELFSSLTKKIESLPKRRMDGLSEKYHKKMFQCSSWATDIQGCLLLRCPDFIDEINEVFKNLNQNLFDLFATIDCKIDQKLEENSFE